jgi:hypothetical protein
MSNNVLSFSPSDAPTADKAADGQSRKIVEAIRTLLSALPEAEQEKVLAELTDALHPISTPKGGAVLGAIVKFLPRRPAWHMKEIKEEVARSQVEATTKEVYNALAYLTRKGHVTRVGYGRYLVGGAAVVTSEDWGEPRRDEDD